VQRHSPAPPGLPPALLAPSAGAAPARRGALRICFVNLGAYAALAPDVAQPIGGEEVQHATLARMLARRTDLSVRLVTCDFGQGRTRAVEGIEVHACYPPRSGLPGLRFLVPRWSGLHAALQRADADLYYVSCAGALVGQVALFARLRRRSLVFRVASDGDCDPPRMLVGSAKERALYRFGLRRASAVAVQTEYQRELLRKSFGRDSVCVPMVFERPQALAPLVQRDVDVLWVANLRSLKQPEKFLELAARLPRRRFHLVGGEVAGETQIARRIAEQAASVSNLVWHGRLGHAETLRLFDRARVFVNTSRIEGFPNTFLQAWVRGVPTVSFVDPDGLIAREALGRAVSDEREMVLAVSRLLDDEAAWMSASTRCRTLVDRLYPVDRQLDPYIALFDRAMNATVR